MIKQFFKKVLISYLIIICCVIVPTQRANANAYGVAVSVAQWVNNAVQISATVNGAYRTVMISPKSPQIAAAIIAGAGGAYVGDYIYKKYGDNIVSWAWDATHSNVRVNLKSGICNWTVQGVDGTYPTKEDAAAALTKGASYTINMIVADSGFVVFNGGNYTLTGKCGDAVANVPVSDIANAAISDAATNADARKLVVDATAANVKPTDFTDAANNPTTNDTTFDASSILSAIQSLFAMLQNLMTNVLDAIKSLAMAIVQPIIDFLQSIWDWLKECWDWFKTTATDWKNAFVDEYKIMRDWVKSDPPPPDDGIVPETPISPTDWQNQANGSYVNFGGSCPAPVQIPISYMGASTNLTISYTPFCQFATMIKPAVILSAYLAGLLIISGGRTKE